MKVRSRINAMKFSVLNVFGRTAMPAIDLGDLQVLAGFASLVYGLSLVSVPAAWMLAGALLLISWAIPRLPRRVKE